MPLAIQAFTMFLDAQNARRTNRQDDVVAETRLKIAAEAVAVAAELGASPDQIEKYVKEYRLALNDTLVFSTDGPVVTPDDDSAVAGDGFGEPVVTPPPSGSKGLGPFASAVARAASPKRDVPPKE